MPRLDCPSVGAETLKLAQAVSAQTSPQHLPVWSDVRCYDLAHKGGPGLCRMQALHGPMDLSGPYPQVAGVQGMRKEVGRPRCTSATPPHQEAQGWK